MPLKQKSVFASVAHVLRTPSMAWLIDSSNAIEEDKSIIVFDRIDRHIASMSSGEKVLIDIARSIWRDDPISLDLQNLDDPSLERVLEALLALRPLGSWRPATEIASDAIGMFMERMEALGGKFIEANPLDLDRVRGEAVQEIRESMAVREGDLR